MTLQLLVERALEREGLEGLFNDDADCACLAGDLAPCGHPNLECKAGVKAACDCGDHDFHVIARKGAA